MPRMKKQTMKLTPIIVSTTFNCWCKWEKKSVCKHILMSLVSNFPFQFTCFHCTYCLDDLTFLLDDFEMIIWNASNTRTYCQLPKLLPLCEFTEWDSSTKAEKVSVNMNLDFNDINYAVFSVYELYPIWNTFIVTFSGKFSEDVKVSSLLGSLW